MALSVFPELMDKIDPKDTESSLRTIESYINYIVERVEFSLTNTFRTTTTLGSSAEAISLVLEDTVNKLSEASSQLAILDAAVKSLIHDIKDYEALNNKPQIASVELVGNKSLAQFGIASQEDHSALEARVSDLEDAGVEANVIEIVKQNGTALPVTDKAVDVTVPTKASDLTNDSGYQTAAQVQAAAEAAVAGVLSEVSLFDLTPAVFPVHQEDISIQTGSNLRTANLRGNYVESFGHNLGGSTFRSLVLTTGRATTQSTSASNFTLYNSDFKAIPTASDKKLFMMVRRFRDDVGNQDSPPQIFVATYDENGKIWWANIATTTLGYLRRRYLLDSRVITNGNLCVFVQFRRPTHTLQASFDLDIVAGDSLIDGATNFTALTDSGKTVQEQT